MNIKQTNQELQAKKDEMESKLQLLEKSSSEEMKVAQMKLRESEQKITDSQKALASMQEELDQERRCKEKVQSECTLISVSSSPFSCIPTVGTEIPEIKNRRG